MMLLGESNMLSYGMLLAGMVVLGWVMLRLARRRRNSAKAENASAPPDSTARRQSTIAPPEASRWMVELQEHSREVRAEIDTKLVTLQVLLRQTEEERARLEAAIAEARRLGLDRRPDLLEALAEEPENARDLEAYAAPRERLTLDRPKIYALADRGAAADEIARRLGLAVGDVEIVLSLRPVPSSS